MSVYYLCVIKMMIEFICYISLFMFTGDAKTASQKQLGFVRKNFDNRVPILWDCEEFTANANKTRIAIILKPVSLTETPLCMLSPQLFRGNLVLFRPLLPNSFHTEYSNMPLNTLGANIHCSLTHPSSHFPYANATPANSLKLSSSRIAFPSVHISLY